MVKTQQNVPLLQGVYSTLIVVWWLHKNNCYTATSILTVQIQTFTCMCSSSVLNRTEGKKTQNNYDFWSLFKRNSCPILWQEHAFILCIAGGWHRSAFYIDKLQSECGAALPFPPSNHNWPEKWLSISCALLPLDDGFSGSPRLSALMAVCENCHICDIAARVHCRVAALRLFG